jgi:hypothetical protein
MASDQPGLLDQVLRINQIIIGGLVVGVVFFMVIVLAFLGARVQPLDPQAIVSIVMAAFALMMLPARFAVPGLIVSSNCRKIAQGTWQPRQQPGAAIPDTDEGKLLQLFQVKTIVGAALLEGAAFGNLVAFLLEGQVYSLALAVLFALGILVGFPTRSGLSEWLETQQRRLNEYQ